MSKNTAILKNWRNLDASRESRSVLSPKRIFHPLAIRVYNMTTTSVSPPFLGYALLKPYRYLNKP